MAFKSTGIAMSTTPQLIVGPSTAAVINTAQASYNDPVVVAIVNNSGGVVYLAGSNAALGAAPAVGILTTAAGDVSRRLDISIPNGSDSIWAGTTAATGNLLVFGTRQQSA